MVSAINVRSHVRDRWCLSNWDLWKWLRLAVPSVKEIVKKSTQLTPTVESVIKDEGPRTMGYSKPD